MLLAAAALVMSLGAARADWLFDGSSGVVYESNLSNSDRDEDVKDDWAWKSDLRISNGFQVSRDLRMNFGADLRSELWDRYAGFNQIGPGTIEGARYRFGLGRLAPWVLVENRIGYDRFQDTDQSGYDENIDVRGGIALSDRVALEAGYRFENFVAPDDFYDQQSHHADGRITIDLTPTVQVAVGYGYRRGDVISYAVPPRLDIARFATEKEDITIFGTNPRYIAYKFSGRTHSLDVSAGYAVNKYFSIQVGYEYSVTTRDPLSYENHTVEATLAFAY
jgi:Outer membrane protein beta-barrel domain